ncbi:glycosyltransferase [Priestia abyssalis]|uniref:glycosyltransferase n=1 Tax=Priestia abyssalis TaxID=1221450 RepID=UPI000994FAED|nr:glycosyltransferase [Priestia abyssalis]
MKTNQLTVIYAPFSYFSKMGEAHWDETDLYQEMIQFYLPLFHYLEDEEIPPCTIAISPLLLELWDRPDFQQRFFLYLQKEKKEDSLRLFLRWNRNLLNGLRYLSEQGKIECIPTTASHCLLPFLSTRKGKAIQISYGIHIFEVCFHKKPRGFWVEEGFITEEIEEILHGEGIQYTFLNRKFLLEDDQVASNPYVSSRNIVIIPYDQEVKALSNVFMASIETGSIPKKLFSLLKKRKSESINFQLPKQFFTENVHSSTIRRKAAVNRKFREQWLNQLTQEIYTIVYEMEEILWKIMDFAQSALFLQMMKIWFIVASKGWVQFLTKDMEKKEYVLDCLNMHVKHFKSLYKMVDEGSIINESTDVPIFSYLSIEHLRMLRGTFSNEPLYLDNEEHSRLNILMLSWEFPPLVVGGLSRHVFDLSRTLTKQGHQVFVITTFVEGLPAYEKIQGVHVCRVLSLQPHHSDFFAWVNSLNAAMVHEGLRLCKHIPFHIVHAHDWLVGSAARVIQAQLNIPLICTIHATEHGRNNGIHNALQESVHEKERRLIHDAHAVIVCSEYMKKELIDLFYVRPDKISVFPNGIEPGMFLSQCRPNNLQKKYQLCSDDRLIFSVGRVVYEKGFHILIEAAEIIRKEKANVRVIIAGKGPLLHEYRALIKEKKLEKHIQFIGYITDDERNQLFHLSDIVVFPSLYEPFGIVALEGMVVGKPTIVTNTGGLQTIVEDGVSGIKVRPNDAVHLAEKILVLLQDKEYARRLGEKGKKRVETMFGWDHIATETIKLFEENVVTFQEEGGE